MDKQTIASFNVIGIAVRTTNENGQAGTDIPALWAKWTAEGIIDNIPNKLDHNIYSIYTDYELDHMRPYTTILGCKVANLENIPTGMVGKTIPVANYQKFLASGNLTEGAVYNEWTKIWNTPLERAFTADFELYDQKSHDLTNGEVGIYIALK